MTVGITGATGFVGVNLTRNLNEATSHNTLLINRPIDPASSLIRECDVLVHLAGKAHDLKNSADSQEYYKVNFDLTKSLFDTFLDSKAKKFIFISSVKAAADHLDVPLTEEHPPHPLTDYGKSKLMAEQYIQSRHPSDGKSYYILRPCMIHGPGNKGNLNLLYRFVSLGLPYPLAAFNNRRSFLSIENLCFVIQEIIERDDIPSGIYNVADDEALSTNDLIELLSQATGKTPKLWNIPAGTIRQIARIGDKLKLPLNTERLGKLTENYAVSNARITSALGKEMPVSAREGIRVTGKWLGSLKV